MRNKAALQARTPHLATSMGLFGGSKSRPGVQDIATVAGSIHVSIVPSDLEQREERACVCSRGQDVGVMEQPEGQK